jgi:hypothetical protein
MIMIVGPSAACHQCHCCVFDSARDLTFPWQRTYCSIYNRFLYRSGKPRLVRVQMI